MGLNSRLSAYPGKNQQVVDEFLHAVEASKARDEIFGLVINYQHICDSRLRNPETTISGSFKSWKPPSKISSSALGRIIPWFSGAIQRFGL
jgi:hypothetical protein